MATNPHTYKLNHYMIRVKEPQRSIKFYEHLGMKLLKKMEMPDAKFDLYFLGYDSPKATSHGKDLSDREGLIELTHNYGTENDDSFKVNNGNSDPGKGFGHVCISVDNIQAACKRIEDEGYRFQKKLSDGKMHHVAFCLDTDGYWVELIGQKPVEETEKIETTDPETYRMNHTMIRVKDIEKSLKFYQDVMGMTLIKTSEFPHAKFNLYFLAYTGGKPLPAETSNVPQQSLREGILELTYNYGTEKDENFKYHNGNDEPQGFGHICISVDNIEAACKRFDDLNVRWRKRLVDGRMKNVAFALDPDDYWVEVIQHDILKGKSDL